MRGVGNTGSVHFTGHDVACVWLSVSLSVTRLSNGHNVTSAPVKVPSVTGPKVGRPAH